ncbi:hypothetical protein [Burkholderia cepacia]|nr:hypothetical protein [Burkholderia cepacia]
MQEQVLNALDLVDEFVTELTWMREILKPLEARQPDDGFGDR